MSDHTPRAITERDRAAMRHQGQVYAVALDLHERYEGAYRMEQPDAGYWGDQFRAFMLNLHAADYDLWFHA